MPLDQGARRSMTLAVRTTSPTPGLPGAIETEIHRLDPDQPASGMQTMEQVVATSLIAQRVSATLTAALGALALLLAVMGLYGVVAYVTARRVPELAIRMALGARRGDVLRLVLGQGASLALIGIGVGLATAPSPRAGC